MEKQISYEMTEPNQDEIHEMMVHKATELFKVCDKEENGVISKRDMQRLRSELPLSPDQLEEVFDSLDVDGNGFLTLTEFIDGFERIRTKSTNPPISPRTSTSERTLPGFRNKKLQSLHRSFLGMKPSTGYMEVEEGESRVYEAEDDGNNNAETEKQFQEMMNNVGAKKFFNDDETIKALWIKLRADEPELVGDFEEFLNRVTGNIKQSQNDFETLEAALRNKNSAHDEEIRKLYEEMETQIKQERERILKEEKAKERQLREEMEREISEKDRQLQDLLQKHQEMEDQLKMLNTTETETKHENERLLRDKDRLEEMLMTSQERLEESKLYINQLREHEKNTSKERARAALRMTEGIALERESLVKQLDLLRDMNRQLRDDKDEAEAAESRRDPSPNPCEQVSRSQALATSEALPDRDNAKSRRKEQLTKQGSVLSNYFPTSLDRRHSSRVSETLSEDIDGHLADIEDDVECDEVYVNSNALITNNLSSVNGHAHAQAHEEMYKSHGHGSYATHVKSDYNASRSSSKDDNWSDAESDKAARGHNSRHKGPSGGQRGQPVGATATVENTDGETQSAQPTGPERIFKIVFVGDSGVGKSTFIYQFCHNTFKSTFSATIGVDFQIKTIISEGKMIALQLWDTAGQERFRSITKQYFRKADGVIIMYDVTSENSFIGIRNWMNSVKDGVDDDAVLVIVGNKTDLAESDDKRVVKTKDGSRLADEYSALFYESSAKSGSGVKEAMNALACLLREKEDKSIEAALKLEAGVVKKKGCCSR